MHAHTWVSSLFFFYERDCSILLACLLASIQPRTSSSKFGGKYSILFTGVLKDDGFKPNSPRSPRASKGKDAPQPGDSLLRDFLAEHAVTTRAYPAGHSFSSLGKFIMVQG